MLPGEARYDAARLVDNAAIDRRPTAIVMARDVEDVVATLALAQSSGVPLAARGGGAKAGEVTAALHQAGTRP